MSIETIKFDEEHDTLGKRLKHSRETRRLTRKELAAMSGVGYKTIENYEYEKADAKTSVVDALADALGVSGATLQYGLSSGVVPIPPASKDDEVSAAPEAPEPTRIEVTQSLLGKIEELRHDGFANTPRLSIALLNDLRNSFRYLEVGEIVEIGQAAGLDELDDLATYVPKPPTEDQTRDPGIFFITDNAEKQEDALELLFERLIDTTIIGSDLYELSFDQLKEIAKEHEVASPFFGWDDADQIIATLRPILRLKALTAHDPLDLGNEG